MAPDSLPGDAAGSVICPPRSGPVPVSWPPGQGPVPSGRPGLGPVNEQGRGVS